MKKFGVGLLFVFIALVLAACTPGEDSGVRFSATLNGANERPDPVTTDGTGSFTATLEGNSLMVEGTFSGLSGAPTAAHIHEGSRDEAGPVVFPLTLMTVTTNSGSFDQTLTLTAAEIATLESDDYYVNVHTANNPGGEIRGQLERLLED